MGTLGWSGSQYWGYGAQPLTTDIDEKEWQGYMREETERNFWPAHAMTGYKTREGRRDDQRREFQKEDLAKSGKLLPLSTYGKTSPRENIGNAPGSSIGRTTGYGVTSELDKAGSEAGYFGVNQQWIDDQKTGRWNTRGKEGLIQEQMQTPAPEALGEPRRQSMQDEDMYAKRDVTGWTYSEETGLYKGVDAVGNMVESRVEPNIVQLPEEPQSQASMLGDYNRGVSDSIQGYYNQLRSDAERQYKANFPRYQQPGPKDLGISTSGKAGGKWGAMWRASSRAGGTQESPLSQLYDKHNAQYDQTVSRYKGQQKDTINDIEEGRQKALYSAHQQAMSRSYNLEKQLLRARTKPLDPYTSQDNTRKALKTAQSMAEFSEFIHPEKRGWKSRTAEMDAAKAGKLQWVVDESDMPSGTTPEYVANARAATDLLNTFYSKASTVQRVDEKAETFRQANIRYEESMLRREQTRSQEMRARREERAEERRGGEDGGRRERREREELLFGDFDY